MELAIKSHGFTLSFGQSGRSDERVVCIKRDDFLLKERRQNIRERLARYSTLAKYGGGHGDSLEQCFQ